MMRRDFARRSDEAEMMDAPDVEAATFEACLDDLAKVNRLTLAYRPTLDFLERLRRDGAFGDQPVRIVDVGSGRGDLLQVIADWGRRRGVALDLTGIDLNPASATAAARCWKGDPQPHWITADVFNQTPVCDVVVSSLFTHHLTDAQVVRFLRWMQDRARTAWFVNDLLRHPVAFHGFGLLARMMRWHLFVRHDGPVSIARAFRPEDWRRYVTAAGLDIDEVRVERRFPFRLCVSGGPAIR